MDLGKHAVFIWSSYAAVVFVLAALIAWLIADGRHQAAERRKLESEGITRRSKQGQSS